jgi:hypothetical protein
MLDLRSTNTSAFDADTQVSDHDSLQHVARR